MSDDDKPVSEFVGEKVAEHHINNFLDSVEPDELREIADEMEDDKADESGDKVPHELESMLTWATFCVAPDNLAGDYIASWDDSQSLQSRNMESLSRSDRFNLTYIHWGEKNVYPDAHVELLIEDSQISDD